MAFNLSQDFVQAGQRIKRKYFRIPKDQEKLLENVSDETWYENLNRGPRPMVNVPPEALEHFHRPKSADLAQESTRVQPATPNAPSTLPDRLPGENEDNAEGTPVSGWSSSLSRRGPDQSVQRVEQTPLPGPSFAYALQHPQSNSKARPASQDIRPSSSAAQSEALEIQPLEALNQESETPVNRPSIRAVAIDSARPGTTPPSAQQRTIPSTLSGTDQSGEQQPPAKKQRRTAEPTLPDKEAQPRERSRVPKTSTRTLPMVPGSNLNSSAIKTSTPSQQNKAALVHSSVQQSSLPKTTPGSGAHEDSSYNLTPTWEGRRDAMATQREKLIRAPESSITLSGPRPAQAVQRGSKPNSTRQSLPPAQNSPTTRTPYEKFRVAYPGYEESVFTFVSALLNVERLKRDRELAEFLYDDFVRAFSTGYLQYIAMSLVRKSNQILTAVQWYNDNVKSVQYCQNVITKGNIHDMVKGHPTEVRKVQESIGGSGLTVDGAGHEELDENLEDGAAHGEHDVQAQEPLESERNEAALALASSPELHIDSPGAMGVETTTVPVRSETSSMSRAEPMNGEQPSYMITANEFDTNGNSSSEDARLGKRSQRQFPLAEEVDESTDRLVLDNHGKEASNLTQNDTRVGEATGDKELRAPSAEVEHAMKKDMPQSRISPELFISSPGLGLAGVAASVEDEQPDFVDGPHPGTSSPSGSFASQEDVQMEDYTGNEEPEDNPESPIANDQSRAFSETDRQSSEAVPTKGVHHNRATPEPKATPGIRKSSVVRDSVRKSFAYPMVRTPAASEKGSVPRRVLAPLPSSSPPPSRTRDTTFNGDESVHERPKSPHSKEAQKEFCILADSSDEEEEAFDPPAKEVAIPMRRTAAYPLMANRAQSRSYGEESNTFDMPIKVTVPLPRTVARSLPASKSAMASRTSPAASTAIPAASKQTEIVQKIVTNRQRVLSRVSTGSFSGAGKSGSPVSSERSHANVPRSKKRVNETKEERSRRFKEYLNKRYSGKTPSSTPVSK